MMDLGHFANLHGRARTRKAALILERIERQWREAEVASDSNEHNFEFARALAEFLVFSEESSDDVVTSARSFLDLPLGIEPDAELRALNSLRHQLAVISGQSPADWDFILSPRPVGSRMSRASGMRAYLEDIRSPFNVGSIFRTAEALGFEEIILSPDCADPLHPRALRTAMGTVERLPWRRAPLAELSGMQGSFALEVGGVALDSFTFPQPGIMVLGSEELGVSAQAMHLCVRGAVEIPLVGSKASLNVATAFGIAGYAWISSVNFHSKG